MDKGKELGNQKEKTMIKKKLIRMITAGVFCVGVLMGGVGSGIAFAEFSGFSYQSVETPQEAFKTEKFTYRMPEEIEKKIGIDRFYGGSFCKLESRENIPKGQAEIYITYNTQACSVEFRDVMDNEDNVQLRFYLDCGGDFENFMKVKDDFLEGLRKKEVHDYQIDYVKSMEVRVNPEDEGRFYWN